MVCPADQSFNISSIIGWTFAVVGLAATLVGWSFRGRQQKFIATRKDVHDSIDKAVKALTDFEDCAVSFWSEKETKFSQQNLLILHKRVVTACKQVSELNRLAVPNHFLSELRKASTLDCETVRRPISSSAPRVLRISATANKLMDSNHFMKTWISVEEPKISDIFMK